MKKITSILMALLAMVLCFAGCTPADDDGSSTTPDVSNVNATVESDYEYIKEKGTLIVGVTNFSPIDYLDENNQWTGFDADFANAVGEKLGVTVQFQEIVWNSKETELASKGIDCIWNGLTITPERLATMSISTPYMANKQVLVVRADRLEEIKALSAADGLAIVAEAESAGETVATTESFFANANYTAVDSQSKALTEVKSGTADGCVVDYVCSIGMIGEGTSYEDLVVVDTLSFVDEQYGIAFRQGSDLTARVNTIISELVEDGTLGDIAAKYKLTEQLIAK